MYSDKKDPHKIGEIALMAVTYNANNSSDAKLLVLSPVVGITYIWTIV